MWPEWPQKTDLRLIEKILCGSLRFVFECPWIRFLASGLSPHLHFPEGRPGRINSQRRGVGCYLKPGELPHVSDDQVGGRDEEVADSLESRSDGVMHFAHTGLRNHLRTTESRSWHWRPWMEVNKDLSISSRAWASRVANITQYGRAIVGQITPLYS